MKQSELFTLPGRGLYRQLPEVADFFSSFDLELSESDQCVDALLDSLSAPQLQQLGMPPAQVRTALSEYVAGVEQLAVDEDSVHSIRIRGGRDKSGSAEDVDIELAPGQIVSIVGPTGAG
jgi:ABC-type glutathione transport system ATPase component